MRYYEILIFCDLSLHTKTQTQRLQSMYFNIFSSSQYSSSRTNTMHDYYGGYFGLIIECLRTLTFYQLNQKAGEDVRNNQRLLPVNECVHKMLRTEMESQDTLLRTLMLNSTASTRLKTIQPESRMVLLIFVGPEKRSGRRAIKHSRLHPFPS